MESRTVIFYLIAAMILIGGFLAVTTRKIFRAAIYLLFSLTGIAGLYFWLDAQFIAAVQIIVYVGGIVVLIIFSIFLTQQSGVDLPKPFASRRLFGLLAACSGFLLTVSQISLYTFVPHTSPAIDSGVAGIGTAMLNSNEHGYVLPFEVISILLLAAMIGCIVIAIKKPEQV